MTENEIRISELEHQLDELTLRYSALEWIVEQHLSLNLVGVPLGRAEAFLTGLQRPMPVRQDEVEVGAGARPDRVARLYEYVVHITEKIRTRVREGVRSL